jgi:hypothetical protein
MEDYEEFKRRMADLDEFIESCETKEIDDQVHIVIDDDNVNEFIEIVTKLINVASNADGYVEEIMEYLNDIDKKITDKNMIAKFIPLFAAIHSFATMKTLPDPNNEVKIDDWIFELSDMDKPAPLDARFGKVINIVTNEDKTVTYKVKAPLANEIVEWEDAIFIVIPNMEETLKKYQDKYTKTF